MSDFLIYALCPSRDRRLALKFLNTFAPLRSPLFEGVSCDMEGESVDLGVLADDSTLQFFENHPTAEAMLYWEDKESGLQCVLCYTNDGCLIAGLDPGAHTQARMKKVKEFLNTDFAYLSGDQPPPADRAAFLECLRTSQLLDNQIGEVGPR